MAAGARVGDAAGVADAVSGFFAIVLSPVAGFEPHAMAKIVKHSVVRSVYVRIFIILNLKKDPFELSLSDPLENFGDRCSLTVHEHTYTIDASR